MSADPVLTHAAGAVQSVVDGDRVLLSPRDFSFFALAGTGADVWDLLDGRRPLSAIVTELAARYSAEPGRIHDETVTFVTALVDAGLVVEAEARLDAAP